MGGASVGGVSSMGQIASISMASFLSGENLEVRLVTAADTSGGRCESVLSWFCSGEEVDSSLVLAASVEMDEPVKRI